MLVSFGAAGYAYAQSAEPSQRYNPFAAQPLLDHASAHTNNIRRKPTTIRLPSEHPRLRAVLQARDGGLANLAGVVLNIGEASQGYRLLAVGEHSALFGYGPYKVELTLAGTATE